MILTCAECNEQFVARYWQRVRANKGKTVFACSLTCRGRYGKKAVNKKFGLNPLDTKNLARSRLRGAVRHGDMKRPASCEFCHKTDVQIYAHHYAGYDKAYHVQWLCSACHADADRHTKVRGTKHPNAKLADYEVQKIRKELLMGKSLLYLAKVFGVSKKTIVNIKHDRIWRHVT